MKLIDLTCPKCNATLKVNSDLTKCTCNYCGHEILIDSENKEIKLTGGYDFGYDSTLGKLQAEHDFHQEHPTEQQLYLEQQKVFYNKKVRISSLKRAWHYATIVGLLGFFVALISWSEFALGLGIGAGCLILTFILVYIVQLRLYLIKK